MAAEALRIVAAQGGDADPQALVREIVADCRPVLLRGLCNDWPAVAAGRTSPQAFADYAAPFARGTPIGTFVGDAAIKGRYFYSDDLSAFNFRHEDLPFAEALQTIAAGAADAAAPTRYAGSIPIDTYLPGFDAHNRLRALPGVPPRLWIGHASRAAAHYDTSDNIACCVAGRRRFTLYAPQLIGDLYVGPIDNTIAGQPVSLAAASSAPLGTWPRFDAIRDRALVAELEPGDALYIPKLWWHQVEGLAPFNVLVNYWWDATASGPDQPYTAMMLAMIAIAERPAGERAAWRALFDNYVFRPERHPLEHLPAERHGILGPLRPTNYGRIRAWVMSMLRGG